MIIFDQNICLLCFCLGPVGDGGRSECGRDQKGRKRIRRVRSINSDSVEAWILWTIAATPGYGSCSKRMQSNEKLLSSIKAEVT